MADTTTTTYGLTKPEVGGSTDTWGQKINNVIDDLDDLLDGTTPVTGIDINSGTIDGVTIGASSAPTVTNIDINGGTIDGVTIGGASAGAGTFTTFTSTGIDDNADATAITIDSSERLLIGTTTARDNFSASTSGSVKLSVEGTGADNTKIATVRNVNGTNGPYLVLGKSRSAGVNGVTVVQSGDQLGSISFQGADGGALEEAAVIRAEVDGTPGTNDMPGRLVFLTTADGANSPTERIRIDSNGLSFDGGSNHLDNYEEGTFTLTFNTSFAGAQNFTNTVPGRYTKVGKMVHCEFEAPMNGSNSIGVDDRFEMVGLPFIAETGQASQGIANFHSTYGSGNSSHWGLRVSANELLLWCFHEAGAVDYGDQLQGSITYEVD